jgi:serine/threonine protein kinase
VREARIAQAVRSEFIAPVLGTGATRTTMWIMYRRIDGETMEARLRRDLVLPAAEVRRFIDHVLQGLAVAHAAGVIHRDVKPANIMLERVGDIEKACILDFGVSKYRPMGPDGPMSTEGLTTESATLGTLNYMPPEQIGASQRVDARADLYATAVVAFRALTGQFPFAGATEMAMMGAKLKDQALTPRQATGARWPQPLEDFFRTALAHAPADRFVDAGAMRAAWGAAMRGELPKVDRLRATLIASREGEDTIIDT